MAMKLKKIERANPANPDQKKWYLTRDGGRHVDLDDIAEDIQSRSAMTKGDILSVLSNLVQVLPGHLKKAIPSAWAASGLSVCPFPARGPKARRRSTRAA